MSMPTLLLILHVATQVQPITRSVIKVDLIITPDFKWNVRSPPPNLMLYECLLKLGLTPVSPSGCAVLAGGLAASKLRCKVDCSQLPDKSSVRPAAAAL